MLRIVLNGLPEGSGELEKLTVLLIIIYILFGFGGIGFALWLKKWTGLIGLSPFFILFFLIAPFFIWREEERKVRRYESRLLELYFEDNDQFIQKRGNNWIFRIGIRTMGMVSVSNVEVKLYEIDGKKNSYSDAPLRPAYCLSDEPSSFMVKPGETKFVEIASWGQGDCNLRIHYHTNYQLQLSGDLDESTAPFLLSNTIDSGRRRITLVASGNDTAQVATTFIISTDAKRPALERD